MLTADETRRHLDALAKSPSRPGRLEDLAAKLCLSQQTLAPQTTPRRAVVFAAYHGVVAAWVSAWPSVVTRVVDVGVDPAPARRTRFDT